MRVFSPSAISQLLSLEQPVCSAGGALGSNVGLASCDIYLFSDLAANVEQELPSRALPPKGQY